MILQNPEADTGFGSDGNGEPAPNALSIEGTASRYCNENESMKSVYVLFQL